jgi:hypothetical protein
MMNAVAENVRDGNEVFARVRNLPNDALIIELIQTLNHLSRWLTPIHDRTRLEFSARRSELSVKEILLGLRDTETRVYSLMYVIANEVNPDLDRVPHVLRTPAQIAFDRDSNALVIMSEFRRVRESTTSLMRALPDTAWDRGGFSRTERDWTIRELAEYLAVNDWERLREIDSNLSRIGAREGIAKVSRVSLDEIDDVFATAVGR